MDVGNNNRGYAHQYDVTAADLTGIVGSPLCAVAIRCTGVDEKTFDGCLWRSALTPVGGHLIYYELLVDISNGLPTKAIKVSVFDQTAGILIAADAPPRAPLDLAFLEARHVVTSPTHPTLLNTISTVVDFQCTAIRWPP